MQRYRQVVVALAGHRRRLDAEELLRTGGQAVALGAMHGRVVESVHVRWRLVAGKNGCCGKCKAIGYEMESAILWLLNPFKHNLNGEGPGYLYATLNSIFSTVLKIRVCFLRHLRNSGFT